VLKQRHQLFVALLVLLDALVVTAASMAAWGARILILREDPRWDEFLRHTLLLFTIPIVLFCLRWFGLYRPRRDRSLLNEAAEIAKACAAALLGILAAMYLFDDSLLRTPSAVITVFGYSLDAGRIQLLSLAAVLPTAVIAHRLFFRVVLRLMRRRGWNQRHVAIIGCGRLAQIVARTFARNSWTGLQVAFFISHQDQTKRLSCLDRPVVGGLNDLETIMAERKPDAVYVALPSMRSNLLTSVLSRLEKFPVDVRVVPDVTPRHLPQNMAVSELDGMPILSYRECPTRGVGGVWKRILDLIGALVALLLFSPVMLLAALLVRLSGPGPIIFKQRRVSLGGEVFNIYKFRTMYHVEDEEAGAGGGKTGGVRWTERNDPRITPIGRLMRRTSIDEFPQLFNVIMGEMSLVGPRPERPELIERFRDDWRGYMLRQHVKAGMTGWAQVNGHRGQTSLRKRLQYDLFYIKNWSILFDLKILWLTLFRGFVHRNAH
jgi:exopolysaccharide biosynthesis polyprenyl glycosylphosphotransferase